MKTPKMLAAALGTRFVALLTVGATDGLAATQDDVQSPRAQVSVLDSSSRDCGRTAGPSPIALPGRTSKR